jgi:hypothetical protein
MQAYQLAQRFTASGAPLNGGKAYFYLTGTTTPEDVFEDDGLGSALSNPVVADSGGYFPELVYLDPLKTYRLIIKSADDSVTYCDQDPINTPEGGSGIGTDGIADDAVTADKLAPGAIEDKLGYTPQQDLTALSATAKNALLDRIGEVFYTAKTSAPTGSLKCNGATIGSATSGATNAHADYAALFAVLWAWDNTASPILDSAGSASTRGASASADFAANKRLTLPDLRAEWIRGLDDGRGVDTGRAIGRTQAEQMPAHSHTFYSTRTDIGAGGQTVTGGIGSGSSTGSTGGTDNSSELRPRNVALLACIYY